MSIANNYDKSILSGNTRNAKMVGEHLPGKGMRSLVE